MARAPILVVGGGIAGMAAAIALAQRGLAVDLVEEDPAWRVYGAGITITGATYRAFAELGMLAGLQANGYGARGGTRICTPEGRVLMEVPAREIAPGIPPIGAMMRPALHTLLSARTRAGGVDVRLGVTIADWVDDADGVDASFTDGSERRYEAIIVADGAFSRNRQRICPDSPAPCYTGQYCWRVVAERPAAIDRAYMFPAGRVFAGLGPTSETSMYMWLLEARPEKRRIEAGTEAALLAEIMAPFGGPLAAVRDGLGKHSTVVVRPLEAVLAPPPWYRGRAILIGDAAHSTTPHLASGAGIAVEDAIILADLIASRPTIESAFGAFMAARFDRCRDVVESSVRIGAAQQADASPPALGALIAAAEARLQVDIWADAAPVH